MNYPNRPRKVVMEMDGELTDLSDLILISMEEGTDLLWFVLTGGVLLHHARHRSRRWEENQDHERRLSISIEGIAESEGFAQTTGPQGDGCPRVRHHLA